jgi:hypothetical protein
MENITKRPLFFPESKIPSFTPTQNKRQKLHNWILLFRFITTKQIHAPVMDHSLVRQR